MADKPSPNRFVSEPIPSKDDGSKTLYERNVERVRAETPPAEPVNRSGS